MAKGLLFGTAGAPESSNLPTTDAGIERIFELGLDCMEVQFVQGVRMSAATARAVAETAERRLVRLSVHAPYFINLNAREPDKVVAGKHRLVRAARIASLLGAESVVFHAAFYLGDDPPEVYGRVKSALGEVVSLLKEEGNQVTLRPETMGKTSQFGTLEDVLRLSAEIEGVAPCIDFSHCHAREGACNSYEEFTRILEKMQRMLGRQALEHMHMHVAGVEYGSRGEIKHVNLRKSDLRYVELLEALRDFEVRGRIICESPNLEGDALLLRRIFRSL